MADSIYLIFMLLGFISGGFGIQHCASRTFANFNGTLRSFESCPYYLNAAQWTAGWMSEMELASRDGELFQVFLVSVQYGNTLIGAMVSEDDVTMATCGNTSLQHSDMSNKSSVAFQWKAPVDLAASEVIVRMSVGTETEFWKDCSSFYLRKAGGSLGSRPTIATLPTAAVPPSTTTGNLLDTTTRRLAEPDNADSESKITLKHKVVNSTSCKEYGNMFSVMPGSDCRQYKVTVGSRSWVHDCPPTTVFDIKDCTCSFKTDCKA